MCTHAQVNTRVRVRDTVAGSSTGTRRGIGIQVKEQVRKYRVASRQVQGAGYHGGQSMEGIPQGGLGRERERAGDREREREHYICRHVNLFVFSPSI